MNQCTDQVYRTKTAALDAAIVDYGFDCVPFAVGKVWKLKPKVELVAPTNKEVKAMLDAETKKDIDALISDIDAQTAAAEMFAEFDAVNEQVDETIRAIHAREANYQSNKQRKVQSLEMPLFNAKFPNVITKEDKQGNETEKRLATIGNLRYLLHAYAITVEYDVILKRQAIYFNDKTGHDLEDESALIVIRSLCALNQLPITTSEMLTPLFVENTRNPVIEWITSTPWDRIDRVKQLCNSLQPIDVMNDVDFRDKVLRLWLTQCVAAADNAEIGCAINKNAIAKFELVLILQGAQGAQKTSWFNALVPNSLRDYLKDGIHLDTTDRDSKKKAVSTWICELGEIDATFRKSDIAQLKAFLSNQSDEMRLAYARTEARFKRRTSFCASVNGEQFLSDSTGSRRFISLPIHTCYVAHNINMQQVWAQVWHDYNNGAIWWTDSALDVEIKQRNEKHNETSAIGETIAIYFNINDRDIAGAEHVSVTSILMSSGIREPKRAQVKEATEFLSSRGFKFKQGVGGIRGFTIAKLFV